MTTPATAQKDFLSSAFLDQITYLFAERQQLESQLLAFCRTNRNPVILTDTGSSLKAATMGNNNNNNNK